MVEVDGKRFKVFNEVVSKVVKDLEIVINFKVGKIFFLFYNIIIINDNN